MSSATFWTIALGCPVALALAVYGLGLIWGWWL